MKHFELTANQHVLLVDHDTEFGASFAGALSSRGIRVSLCEDAWAARDALEQDAVDAVVIDLDLEEMSGWAFLERVQKTHPRVLPIVISARIDVQGTVRAMRAGAFDVLEKPVRIAELEARLREGLADRSPGLKPSSDAQQGTLRHLARKREGFERMLGNSTAIMRVREQVRGMARFNQVATLIIGETGTGKEMVAEALHGMSAPHEPFVSINCAAIPDSLFESELFGHEAGSFTGARSAKPGLFERAGEGTVLLDEVGEMALSMQPKLLRVLQNRTFRRVGGSRDLELKARVISATNRKLSASRQDGVRSDLYFRLAGFTIVLPPLRSRKDDIELLANQFLLDFSNQYPGVPSRIGPGASDLLLGHHWPGNIRELKRVVEQAAVLAKGNILEREALEQALSDPLAVDEFGIPAESGSFPIVRHFSSAPGVNNGRDRHGERDVDLNELQQQVIVDAYENNSKNLTRAARALHIPRTTLRDRLKRYGRL